MPDPSPTTFLVDGPADRELVCTVRAEARRLAEVGGLARRVADVDIATMEALGNVVLHATSNGGRATVRVELWLDGRGLAVSVADRGRGIAAAGQNPDGGRGLELMRALADRVVVTSSDAGTRVDLRFDAIREPAPQQAFHRRTPATPRGERGLSRRQQPALGD